MDEALRGAFAGGKCLRVLSDAQAVSELPFELDHIIALQHGGPTVLDIFAGMAHS